MERPPFKINNQDMGGWVRVYLAAGEPTGELARFLSHAFTEWQRDNPDLRIRYVVPIQRDGDTVELHAWYDQVFFRDISAMAAQQGE